MADSGVDGPEDRCGFTYDVSTLHDVGACTCWRPTWRDGDCCIWHTDDPGKTLDDFREYEPEVNERLDGATLEKVGFDEVDWFEDTFLIGADVVAVDLREASLSGADLREARLDRVDARHSDFTETTLEEARMTTCDFRNTDFTDARMGQAVFSNVRIGRETVFGTEVVYEKELRSIEDHAVHERTAEAAIWAYREIQDLHEDNALPLEARQYYLREKNMRRRLAWHNDHYGRAIRAEAARWVTGYGMSPYRVVGAAAVIILISAVLYPTTGGLEETIQRNGGQQTITWAIENPESASRFTLAFVFYRSLYFSVVTFTTLGYGDISPIGDVARAVAGIEALLGQLLMALLVFVLSRRIS